MQSDSQNFLPDSDYSLLDHCQHFSSHGRTYLIDSQDLEGFYWTYGTDYFQIHIHDYLVKRDHIFNLRLQQSPDFVAFSSYIKSAHGEQLTPYQPLRSKTCLVAMNQGQQFRFFLHGQSHFQTVEIDFKSLMIEDYLMSQFKLDAGEIQKIFQESHKLLASKLEKISEDILHYKLDSIGSELFYEIKAKEWLSTIINDYYNQQSKGALNEADDRALSNVRAFIDDHYASDIPQDLLAKIAMMSKTKLKNTFKAKYQMTLTEYIQRRRMAMAEQFLTTSRLDIKDVALSVGYQSHSRFSSLFKKYTGRYPHEVQKQANKKAAGSITSCSNCDCNSL